MNIKDFNFQRNIENETIIGVVNPDDNTVVPVEQWRKQEDPTRAKFVVIIDKAVQRGVIISKKQESKRERFDDAQFIAGLTMIENPDVPFIEFGCPSRYDCMMIYNALCAGLDDVLALIGGDAIGKSWIWTGESDPDSEFTLIGAFVFDVEHGYIFSYDKNKVFDVRSVAPFNLKPL